MFETGFSAGRKYCFVLLIFGCATVTGCASIKSSVELGSLNPMTTEPGKTPPETPNWRVMSPSDGITYYMPSRPFKITVTVDATKNQVATVSPGDTIPDLTNRFTLKYNQNYLGTNHAVIGVNSKGLLESSNAGTVSGVAAIFKNLGTLAGDVTALVAKAVPTPPAAPNPSCQANQTYTKLVYPSELSEPSQICNFTITGGIAPTRRALSEAMKPTGNVAAGKDYDGIFYRQDLPYILVLTDTVNNVASEYLAYSPDQAAISFVPASKTLFANNQTNFTLTDGTLTAVDESTDGEIVALSELPADVISAYFSAIGAVFSSLSSNASSQSTLISAQQALAVSQIKYQACKEAIAQSAGKTGADLTAALQVIESTCQ